MQFIEVITLRKSCRDFIPGKRLKVDHHNTLMRAASCTAHASGGPRCRVLWLSPRDSVTEACVAQRHARECSMVYVFVGTEPTAIMRSGYYKAPMDCVIAAYQAHLAATDLGLGSCLIGNFYPEKMRELLTLKEDEHPVILLVVGYPKYG